VEMVDAESNTVATGEIFFPVWPFFRNQAHSFIKKTFVIYKTADSL
jgi:hypothetical protein